MSKDTAFVVLGTDEEYDDGLSGSHHNIFNKRWWNKKLSREGLMDAYHYVTYPNGSPLWTEIKSNLKPGMTVSLVSVPLSISLAIAGGATPVMGIVTAFWAGLVAAFFGGSHYNIVGPTGALSGVLAASASTYGTQALPVLAVIAGILCFLVWLFKLDKYIMFIPSSVIHGFTVGVAFIIGLNQLNSAFGLSPKVKHESFVLNTLESLKTLPETNLYALGFFTINLTALILLSRRFPKMPWAIVIAAIGILVGFLTSKNIIPITLKTLQSSYGDLTMQIVSIPELDSRIFSFEILTSSFGVAFIAILETLISARIADGMTRTEHNQRKEVISIAMANVLCGVMGGIPATAALARTALNIKTGATSRVSGIINCICVLLISLVFLPLFKYIPMSTIAALLVMTAIKMVAMEHMKHMFHHDKKMFWISILSAGTCIVMDTMAGIMVGGIVSLLLFTDQMSVGHTDIQLNKGARLLSSLNLEELDGESNRKPKDSSEMSLINKSSNEETEEYGDTIVYRVTGQLTYVNSIAHVKRIKKIAKDHAGLKHVILSLRHLWYADLDGVDALQDMITALEARQIQVFIAGVIHEAVKVALEQHSFYQTKASTGAVYANYLDCLKELDQGKENAAVEVSVQEGEPSTV